MYPRPIPEDAKIKRALYVGGVTLVDHAPDERGIGRLDDPAEGLRPPVRLAVGIGRVDDNLKFESHAPDPREGYRQYPVAVRCRFG